MEGERDARFYLRRAGSSTLLASECEGTKDLMTAYVGYLDAIMCIQVALEVLHIEDSAHSDAISAKLVALQRHVSRLEREVPSLLPSVAAAVEMKNANTNLEPVSDLFFEEDVLALAKLFPIRELISTRAAQVACATREGSTFAGDRVGGSASLAGVGLTLDGEVRAPSKIPGVPTPKISTRAPSTPVVSSVAAHNHGHTHKIYGNSLHALVGGVSEVEGEMIPLGEVDGGSDLRMRSSSVLSLASNSSNNAATNQETGSGLTGGIGPEMNLKNPEHTLVICKAMPDHKLAGRVHPLMTATGMPVEWRTADSLPAYRAGLRTKSPLFGSLPHLQVNVGPRFAERVHTMFAVMRMFQQSMRAGALFTEAVFIPKDVWLQKGAKIPDYPDKVRVCQLLLDHVLRMKGETVDTTKQFQGVVCRFGKLVKQLKSDIKGFSTVTVAHSTSGFTGKMKAKLSTAMLTRVADNSTYIDLLARICGAVQFLQNWSVLCAEHPQAVGGEAADAMFMINSFFEHSFVPFVVQDFCVLLKRYITWASNSFLDPPFYGRR